MVDGNRVFYPGDMYTSSADITTIKCLLNSVVSTSDARFMALDIKNFYLNTTMKRKEHMLVHKRMIPPEIIIAYNLQNMFHNDHTLMEISKEMYGFPQAGRLVYGKLAGVLSEVGFEVTTHTPGLFNQKTRPIIFCLVVDDFGVKYTSKNDVEFLLALLRKHYALTADWEGRQF